MAIAEVRRLKWQSRRARELALVAGMLALFFVVLSFWAGPAMLVIAFIEGTMAVGQVKERDVCWRRQAALRACDPTPRLGRRLVWI